MIERLAATEYAIYSSPGHMHRSRFGVFVHIPDFPTRWDANQIFNVRCEKGHTDSFLSELEALYEGTGVSFRKLAFHHTPTAEHLIPTLVASGWDCQRAWMMILSDAPEIPANPQLSIRSVSFHSRELGRIYDDAEELRYRQAQDDRLGGETLIAEAGGVPVGTTGWFVVGGIARFRPVHTIPSYRRRGVATALIRHIIEQTKSHGIQQLCIQCSEHGPVSLYHGLGFKTQGEMWCCVRRTADTGSARE